jgi:hypothetical protein
MRLINAFVGALAALFTASPAMAQTPTPDKLAEQVLAIVNERAPIHIKQLQISLLLQAGVAEKDVLRRRTMDIVRAKAFPAPDGREAVRALLIQRARFDAENYLVANRELLNPVIELRGQFDIWSSSLPSLVQGTQANLDGNWASKSRTRCWQRLP